MGKAGQLASLMARTTAGDAQEATNVELAAAAEQRVSFLESVEARFGAPYLSVGFQAALKAEGVTLRETCLVLVVCLLLGA